jgi:cytochrome c peroxidase
MNRFLTVLAMTLVPAMAGATAIEQAPWAPAAAAYRLTVFLGNLTPVPWSKIEESWEAPVAGASVAQSALSRLTPSQQTAVRAALTSGNRQTVFAAATTVIYQKTLDGLAAAAATLGTAEAAGNVARAQAQFRAFEDGIKAADPAGYRTLGRAWLVLNSAVGTKGVLGTGALEADAERFAAARATIETYLTVNYAPAEFAERRTLSPIPEAAILDGRVVDLPASLPPGSNIAHQAELPRLILQFEEAGIDEVDLPLVAYGDMLFDSPQIFGGPARDLGFACSTCHNRSDVNRDFFIPGLSHRAGGMDVDGAFFNPLFNDRTDDHLDTPSLRGIRFTGPYGRDGREASLRRFTRNVIVTEFAGKEPSPFQLDALVAYMRAFDFLPNPQIDRTGVLTDIASESAMRGEVLFNTPFDGLNGLACASCHTPDRNFRDGQTYDIGTAEPAFEGGTPTSFETPTLRNINFSAPYMHDGSLPTLASVVTWFNDSKSLELDAEQRADLTAYLEAVGDGVEPYHVFEGKESAFRLAFDELTTFASTLNTLLPARDAVNIAILVDTVAPDLAADAGTMTNLAARPEVYRMAETLRAVGDAVESGDWDRAQTYWDSFQRMQAEFDARMF